MGTVFKALAVYYAAVSVLLFILMGIDKRRAVRDMWRIKEATLLIMGLIGGGIGGFIGMKLFHHKTRKWYFYAVFAVGIALHTVFLVMMKNRL